MYILLFLCLADCFSHSLIEYLVVSSLCCPVDEITIFIGHSEAAINLIVNIGPAIMHSHLEFWNSIQFPQCQIQIIDEEGLSGTPAMINKPGDIPSAQSYHKSMLSYL